MHKRESKGALAACGLLEREQSTDGHLSPSEPTRAHLTCPSPRGRYAGSQDASISDGSRATRTSWSRGPYQIFCYSNRQPCSSHDSKGARPVLGAMEQVASGSSSNEQQREHAVRRPECSTYLQCEMQQRAQKQHWFRAWRRGGWSADADGLQQRCRARVLCGRS